MTDRELLEAAAEAAGIKVVRSRLDDPMNRDFLIENSPRNREQAAGPWSPLTDDGDAFRLAVKLGEKFPCFTMGIFSRSAFPHASASIVHRNGDETYIEQDDNADMEETARRAIVRAAAALTRMESKE